MNNASMNPEQSAHRGDITSQPDILAVVNAANAELRTGGGVAESNPVSEITHPSCQTLSPTPPGLFWT